jgi:hypothetical protein
MRAVIVLAIVFGGASPALAGKDVGVVVTGDSVLLSQVSAHVSDWLVRHGRAVVASPIPYDGLLGIIDCFALGHPSCARDIVDTQARTAAIVYVHVTDVARRGAVHDVELSAYWYDKGHAELTERSVCARCTDAGLATATNAMLSKLTRTVLGGVGHLKLRSTPPGARITIDGQPVGVTPLDWEVTPGKHAIGMQQADLTPQRRVVTVTRGRTEVVELTLTEATSDARQAGGDGRVVRGWPLAAVGIGAAGIAAGGALIAIDQAKLRQAPPEVYVSATAGVGLALAGAAVAAVGAYFWFRSPQITSSPVAAVTADSAYLGWLARF